MFGKFPVFLHSENPLQKFDLQVANCPPGELRQNASIFDTKCLSESPRYWEWALTSIARIANWPLQVISRTFERDAIWDAKRRLSSRLTSEEKHKAQNAALSQLLLEKCHQS